MIGELFFGAVTLGTLWALSGSSKPPKKKTDTPPTTSGMLTCAAALDVMSAQGVSGLAVANSVKGLLSAPVTAENATAASKLADQLVLSSMSAPSPASDALRTLAQCLRDYAKKSGGTTPDTTGASSVDALSCEQALTQLDPLLAASAKALLAQPKNADTAKQLRTLALTFESTAANPAVPAQARNVLLTSANCLRIEADGIDKGPGTGGGPKPLKDPFGVTSSLDGGPPVAGVASNPAFQWFYLVQKGDNPFAIAQKFFGSAATWTRVIELVQNNPTEYYSGRTLGSVGDPKNPQSTGYNFASLQAGDMLKIPKAWNAWVDQEGTRRGQPIPFPKVT